MIAQLFLLAGVLMAAIIIINVFATQLTSAINWMLPKRKKVGFISPPSATKKKSK